MPKQRPERRIDERRAGAAGTTTINITGNAYSGVLAHGELAGLSADDHPQYFNTTRGDARYTKITTFTTHAADPDAHHAQVHDIIGSDHTVTGSAYKIVGLTNANTVGLLGISGGDGIDIATGAALITPSVDESYAFQWTGNHTWSGLLGSAATFTSGFTGSGWRLDWGVHEANKSHLELDHLTVRGRLSVYELLARQIRATNGNLFVSASAKIETTSGSGSVTMTVEGDNGTDYQPFAVGDLIRAQRFTGASSHQSNMQVTAITVGGDTRAFTATLISGDAPQAGYEFVRLGNTTDTDRQGAIYLSADDTYSPYIDFVDGVDSFADWNTAAVQKARVGNLDGITDSVIGALSGFGLYSDTAVLKGKFYAADGDIVVSDGVIAVESNSSAVSGSGTRLQFSTNTVNLASGTNVGSLHSERYSDSGTIANRVIVASFSDSADEALTRLLAGAGGNRGTLDLTYSPGSGTSDFQLLATTGTIQASTKLTVATAEIEPSFASTTALGSAGKPFSELHVDTLYAGTTSSTDTGHNHNDLYYTETEVDSLLSGYSTTSHTHGGYIDSASLSSTLASYVLTSALTTTLGGYYTESEADALLANKSATGHTHDDRYYTESEVDTLLSDFSDSSELTTTINAAIATHASDDDAHHDLVTVGANLSLVGQQVSLGSDVALIDEAKTWTAEQTFSSGVALPLALGSYWNVNASGEIRSTSPAWSITGQGTRIDPNGDIYAQYLDLSHGRFKVQTMEVDSVRISGGSERWVPGGTTSLKSALTIAADDTSFVLTCEDSIVGHIQQFVPGDNLQLSGVFVEEVPNVTGDSMQGEWAPPDEIGIIDAQNMLTHTLWLTVLSITNNGDSYSYTCNLAYTPQDVIAGTFEKGAAVAGYGNSSDASPLGVVEIAANSSGVGPYMATYQIGDNPWTPTPVTWTGNLSGIAIGTTGEFGFAASSDLNNSSAAFFAASNQGVRQQNVVSSWTDSGETKVLVDPDVGIVMQTANAGYPSFAERTAITWHPDPDSADTSEATAVIQSSRIGTENRLNIAAQGDGANNPEAFISIRASYESSDSSGSGPSITLTAEGIQDSDSAIHLNSPVVNIGEDAGDSTISVYGELSAFSVDAGNVNAEGLSLRLGTGTQGRFFLLREYPTSSTGLPVNAVYVDNGTLKVVQ